MNQAGSPRRVTTMGASDNATVGVSTTRPAARRHVIVAIDAFMATRTGAPIARSASKISIAAFNAMELRPIGGAKGEGGTPQ